jgi:hypothetical protein
MQRKAFTILALLLVAAGIRPALAQDIPSQEQGELHSWFFDALTIGRGYTVSAPDEQFHVGVLPDVLKGETTVNIKVFDHEQFLKRETYVVNATAVEQDSSRLSVSWPLPEGRVIVSPVYEFDIKGAADLYNPAKPLWLRIHYSSYTNDNKGVYYFDKGKQEWVLIPTLINPEDMSLRAAIHLTYAPIAVLADIIPEKGIASWYKYQDCNCAASRDYPHGTLLTVTDQTTGKSVVVEVNDYGPELWTGRIIDLDVLAFDAISNRRKGLTDVTVVPYLPEEDEHESGLPSLFQN